MSYEKVIDALNAMNLSWSDIDRILLNDDTYEDFKERASFDASNYSTTDKPAVRLTRGEEKLVFVDGSGEEVTVSLD